MERINKESVLLVSENTSVMLSNASHTTVLEEIANNKLTIDELLLKLMDRIPAHLIFQIINELEKKGYITDGETSFSDAQNAYWETLGFNTKRLENIFYEKKISLQSIGEIDPSEFLNACEESGIQIDQKSSLHIVLTDDYNHKELNQINKKFRESKKPWLLVKPHGTELLIGPFFVSGKTGCWECLKHRLDLNQPEKSFYQSLKKKEDGPRRPTIGHPSSTNIALNIAVLEIIKFLYSESDHRLVGKILQMTTQSMKTTFHTLVKRPQCKVCGNEKIIKKKPTAIHLKKDTSINNKLGGYRLHSHETTFEKYKHHVSNLTGIIPSLKAYQKDGTTLIHNYSSGRNLALQSTSLFWLNQHMRSGNGGKGKTALQAKTGALCEAIERYSLMYHGQNYRIKSSLSELKEGIHPNSCMNFSKKQYEQREEINAKNTKFYAMTPIPFDEEEEMDWTPIYSITNNSFKYLPSCYCYAQYPARDELRLYAYPDSNGSAAGNTLEEAILQGFLELVERDAVAIWWYNRIKRPMVDLKKANNPYITSILEYYRSINRSLTVLDITTDMGIPVFVAISHSLEPKQPDKILYGFGAHLDANIALERSIIELNQLLPIVTGEIILTKDPVFVDWLNHATLEENDFMLPLENEVKNIATDYPKLCEPNLYDSVQFCVNAAKRNQMETLVLDLTQPDIEMPVVKVMVPGLRHFWKRTAPGRLYDVPVKMGWLNEPLKEEELNPIGIFV
ncbi:TOMM precursor leader peptide-binding protein [Xanthovirga aplysinae]|uniref:TOMM precursor leader peptide-binding protein n=1 Tax=Xanthovirga aplysinae TaxID=2529853 RepID=UPI0012BC2E6C|nr:TOMM precursor leader peptide-binding protein [Xanthovirga aplysinae]MTI32497.1 TOMM precursor leader peptide-binding protein [Xanthovirga aplysinae]